MQEYSLPCAELLRINEPERPCTFLFLRLEPQGKSYAIVDDGSGPILYKLFAEEALPAKGGEAFTRAYELKDIKKMAAPEGSSSPKEDLSHGATAITGYSVADLFRFVKAHGEAFRPKDASKVVDDEGRPLVVYHGSDQDFTVFDRSKGRSNMDRYSGQFFQPVGG